MARVGVGVTGNQSMVAVGTGVSKGGGVALGSGSTVGAEQPKRRLAINKNRLIVRNFWTFTA